MEWWNGWNETAMNETIIVTKTKPTRRLAGSGWEEWGGQRNEVGAAVVRPPVSRPSSPPLPRRRRRGRADSIIHPSDRSDIGFGGSIHSILHFPPSTKTFPFFCCFTFVRCVRPFVKLRSILDLKRCIWVGRSCKRRVLSTSTNHNCSNPSSSRKQWIDRPERTNSILWSTT